MARKAKNGANMTETTTEAMTTETTKKSRGPKKPARVLFEKKMEKVMAEFTELLSPKYASAGDDFRKCIEDAKISFTAGLGLVRGLPEDWKFSGKGTRRRKGFMIGEFVKAKDKFIEVFREKGLGAGPFKVLGAFSSDKSIKLATPEGSVYLPQREVEKVVVPAQEA